MKQREWTYLDRKDWPQGEWSNEPDKIQWQDADTGLPCLIVRNRMGALCGYVGVAEGHRYFGVNYDNVSVDAHGGLTFSDFCQPYGEKGEQGICHVPDRGEPDKVWWLGFDCAHYMDVIPAMKPTLEKFGYYKGISYVRHECQQLAAQLAAVGHEQP